MPIIKFIGINTKDILPKSKDLQMMLSDVFNTNVENITLQVIYSDTISLGVIEQHPYPQIEVQLFERPIEQKQNAARVISNTLQEIGYDNSDVYFTDLKRDSYFVDGKDILV